MNATGLILGQGEAALSFQLEGGVQDLLGRVYDNHALDEQTFRPEASLRTGLTLHLWNGALGDPFQFVYEASAEARFQELTRPQESSSSLRALGSLNSSLALNYSPLELGGDHELQVRLNPLAVTVGLEDPTFRTRLHEEASLRFQAAYQPGVSAAYFNFPTALGFSAGVFGDLGYGLYQYNFGCDDCTGDSSPAETGHYTRLGIGVEAELSWFPFQWISSSLAGLGVYGHYTGESVSLHHADPAYGPDAVGFWVNHLAVGVQYQHVL